MKILLELIKNVDNCECDKKVMKKWLKNVLKNKKQDGILIAY